MSDVKHVWEAGRHRDLVVLARASRLDPAGPWLATLERSLSAWCRQCPPECGVHWYSSLELALRAISWSQVLALAGDQFGPQLLAGLHRQLLAMARHLLVELPYTLTSMRNNHLLGDALGLILLARMFPRARGSRLWARLGEHLFAAQLSRHMRGNGAMIEDSLSYHRFVLEMLVVRVLLGDAPDPVYVALRDASRYLARIGALDDDVPQYGDWDAGRVLASSGDELSVAGTVALGLALTGGSVARPGYDRFDELAWYGPPRPSARPVAPAVATELDGIAQARRGPWRVWFKMLGGPSHGPRRPHLGLDQTQWTVADRRPGHRCVQRVAVGPQRAAGLGRPPGLPARRSRPARAAPGVSLAVLGPRPRRRPARTARPHDPVRLARRLRPARPAGGPGRGGGQHLCRGRRVRRPADPGGVVVADRAAAPRGRAQGRRPQL
jgi:hypothetical protein